MQERQRGHHYVNAVDVGGLLIVQTHSIHKNTENDKYMFMLNMHCNFSYLTLCSALDFFIYFFFIVENAAHGKAVVKNVATEKNTEGTTQNQ